MGETLCTGNSDDYRIHDLGDPRFCGRSEADGGSERGIESGLLFVQPAQVDVRNLTGEVHRYRLLIQTH